MIVVIGEQGQLAMCLRRHLADAVFLSRAQLDLADTSSIRPALMDLRPSFIINAAAYTAVDQAESEPEVAYAVNATAVVEMVETAAELQAPLVHVSTDFVFPGDSSRPYREDDPTHPLGAYGASKLAGEHALQRHPGPWWILRTSWVFSEHGRNFVKTMLRLGRERDTLDVVADQRGRPTYAGHLAEAIHRIVERWRGETAPETGLYHFASRGEATWFDLACAALSEGHELGLIDKRPTVHAIVTSEYPTPATRPAYSVLDTTKLENALAWEIPTWQSGLKTALSAL